MLPRHTMLPSLARLDLHADDDMVRELMDDGWMDLTDEELEEATRDVGARGKIAEWLLRQTPIWREVKRMDAKLRKQEEKNLRWKGPLSDQVRGKPRGKPGGRAKPGKEGR